MGVRVRKNIFVTLTALLVLLLAIFTPMLEANISVHAAEDTSYSEVLEDLQKDDTFDRTKYPAVADDYSISVMQIAESVNGELFVYVYRPSAIFHEDLTATTVRISTGINNNASWRDYRLTLLSTESVFDKYIVEDFTVKADALRYYDIAAIHRRWVKDVDEPAEEGSGNTINEVVFSVEKLFTAATVNGEVSYTCLETEVIVVTDKYVGQLRYSNGFNLYTDKCDSHFIAFSTDRPIDKLMEAEVYYVSCERTWSMDVNGEHFEFEDPVEQYVKLKYTDVASNPADGLFGKKYTWNRIDNVSDFIENEDLKEETIASLKGKEWVLRFAETDYNVIYGLGFVEYSTIVSQVTILRLKFETEGEVYNLGVVDNKQTGSQIPGNNNQDELDPSNGGGSFWVWVLVILSLIFLVLILWPVLPWILQGLVWLILLPFRLIAALIKAIKNSIKNKQENKSKPAKEKAKAKAKTKAKEQEKNSSEKKPKTRIEQRLEDAWKSGYNSGWDAREQKTDVEKGKNT